MRTSLFRSLVSAVAALLIFILVLPAFAAIPVSGNNTVADKSLRGYDPSLPATDRMGGPDAYGYVYLDNAEPNGPRFSWNAHNDSAVTINTWTNTDYGYAGPFNLPFDFVLYGVNYNQIYLSANGYVSFGGTTTNTVSGNFPWSYMPAGIYFWANNMHVGLGGTVVRYQTFWNPTRFVVTYDSLAAYNAPTMRVSAQVILYEDGSIVTQYRNLLGNVQNSYPGSVGIQNNGGSLYLQYSPPVPAETSAVKIFKPCYIVSNPNPADMTQQVPVNTRFVWNRGSCAASFDVYLSTDQAAVNSLSATARVATRITDTSFTPTANLTAASWYYWRVCGHNATTDSIASSVWSFRTFQTSMLSGTRTIGGTNPDFSTIHDAVTALNALGAGTGVTFLIRGGTYTEAPDTIGIAAMVGPNSRVIFRPADTSAVIINKQCTSAQPYGFKLQNVSYLTFDGSPATAPGRRVMTINATNTSYGYHTFWLTNGSNYNSIKNLNMSVGCPNTNSSTQPVYAYFTSGQFPNTPCSYDSIINCQINGGYASVYLYSSGVAMTNWYVAKNQIYDFGYYGGIYLSGCANSMFTRNEITLTTPASTSLSQLCGIYSASSTNVNDVFNGNWIYGLNATSTNTQIYGMYMYSGVEKLISNNIINLDPATANYIYGIYLGQDRADVLYNTVRIGGTGVSNYAFGIYFGNQSRDTLANNIFINERAVTGGNYNVCYYSPWGVTSPPFAFSDYNLFTTVDENTTDNRYIAYFGGQLFNAINNLRGAPGYPWDFHSIGIPPQFVGVPNLHIDPTLPTAVDGAARPFARVTSDIDGDARNDTTPDIGADEGNFIHGTDFFPPQFNFAPLGFWNNSNPRSFAANITDNVYVARDTLRMPRVYYKRSLDSTWSFRRADSVRSDTFFFTIPGYPMGTIVNYYLAAQDTFRNAATFPNGGRGSNPPGTVPPANYAIYFVTNLQLTGIKTIGGTNPDYTTLTSAVTALNSIGVGAGGVTFQIRNGNYTEPSVTITSITDATRPVRFKVDSGATVTFTMTPQTGNTAGLQLKSRYVTIDGSWPRDSVNKHLTITGTTLTSALWFSDSSAFNTVQNCVLDIGTQTNQTYQTVKFGNQTAFPPMTANRVLHCDVNGGYYGMYVYGFDIQRVDSTVIQYNNIKNFYYYGLYAYYGEGLNISHNNLYHTTTSNAGGMYVMYLYGINGSLVDANKIGPLLTTTNGWIYGLYTNGLNVYSNNMIDMGTGSNGWMYGITSTGSGGKFLFNTVSIRGTTTQSSYNSYCYYNSAGGGLPDSLWGNIFQNTRSGPTNTSTNYHVCLWTNVTATIAYSNFNLMSVGSNDANDNRFVGRIGTTNFNIFDDFIRSNWAPFDQNSFPDMAPFVSDSNLHIQRTVQTPIESGAWPHWQVPTDFDGETRGTIYCDIGADEGNFRAAVYSIIQGFVYDSSAMHPVMPNVFISAGRFADTTDANGYYSMVVRTGTYNVVAATACYDSNIVTGVVVDSARIDTIDFQMLHPELSTNHTSIEFAGAPGQRRTTNITLTNTGNGPLHWQAVALTDPHQLAGGGGGGVQPPVNIRVTLNTDKVKNKTSDAAPRTQPSTSSTDQVWGPDAYGYRAMDNDELTFPNYVSFFEIRDIGTRVVSGGPDSIRSTSMDGFTFRYYGQQYNSVWVSNDGYVQFNSTGYAYRYNYQMPQTNYPNGVFVLHRYLVANVYKYYDPITNIFYLEWVGVNGNYTTDSTVFQLQLHGRINALVFAYNNVAFTNLTTTIGIQNAQGANGRYIQCYYNTSTPFTRQLSGYMIAFNDMNPGGGAWPSWLNVAPNTGVTAAHLQTTLTVNAIIDTGITVPATWTGNIRIASDACPNVIMIPVTLAITDAAPEAAAVPSRYKLYQNYPNPFNPSTEIRFDLKQAGWTQLTIYNALGRQVAELVNSQLPAGFHSIQFDGSRFAAGVYFYRIQSGKFTDVKKMVMLK